MFKEEIVATKKGFIIKITAQKIRKYSFEKKEIYRKDITALIPEEYKGKVTLISHPSKKVSNYLDKGLVQTAVWEYEITGTKTPRDPLYPTEKIEKVPAPITSPIKKPATRRRNPKSSAVSKKTK